MNWTALNPGILAALAAAALFGVGTPLARSLLLETGTRHAHKHRHALLMYLRARTR
jgi:drug/metabolite transporter (DMT)-like permease